MKALYDHISVECSKNITKRYSTSFSLGISMLHKEIRDPVYSIYGFVRLADEIVDSFHGYEQEALLTEFKQATLQAIAQKISLNPVLNCFQEVVHNYRIGEELVLAFLESMEMDLRAQQYDRQLFEKYIYGSAEVVGLMCLKVFTRDDPDQYEKLVEPARRLGSAFQKINFLRDLKADTENLGRSYFPGVDFNALSQQKKRHIEHDIEADFRAGYAGIKKLPKRARLGVFMAYAYYRMLFNKIKSLPSERIMNERVRIPNPQKIGMLCWCCVRNNLNLI